MLHRSAGLCWLLVSTALLEAGASGAGDLPLGRLLAFSASVDEAGRPDFSIRGEPSVVSSEEVISGRIVIEGSIPTGVVADVAARLRSTMAGVVGFDSVVSEVLGTLTTARDGRIWQRITMEYVILPSSGSGADVMSTLQEVLPGADHQHSPFREIFKWESALSDSLQSMDVDQWTITAEAPSLEVKEVRRPLNVNTHTTIVPPPTPASPNTPAPTMPPWGGWPSPTTDPTDPCSAWASPCLCALTPGCTWGDADGCRSALGGGQAAVACAACPVQPRCAAAVCGAALDACSCAASPVGCYWDGPRGRCYENSDGVSPAVACRDCARQQGCSPPELALLLPQRGSLLGPAPGGTGESTIHATFDRDVLMCEDRPPGPFVQLHCDLSPVPLAVGSELLAVDRQELTIRVPNISDHFTSNCSLEILERVVCDDAGVPFLGLSIGEYDLLLGEAVAPQILSVDPPNATQDPGVMLPLTVSIVFNERVRLSNAAAGLSVRLEPLDGGSEPAPQLLLVPGNAAVAREELRLDLGSVAQEHTDYSLVLPGGALVDWSGNAFPGLALGEYVFRTGRTRPAELAPESTEDSGLSALAIAGIASGALVVVAVVVYGFVCCRGGGLKRTLSRAWSWNSSATASGEEMTMTNSASVSVGWIFGDRVKLPKGPAPALHTEDEGVEQGRNTNLKPPQARNAW